ncbi:putative transcriptional regulator [Apilactobacillus kunkeei]|uniref:TetR/AcrR family transcriptional regulator n=1 Tax=Apilactobacillus kunkeei TaxID=148814 RepID=UPI0006C4B187|nr:TetR/AcrR family transcriptional regulator [Apilactobacillus kunkeei]KOY76447.1 putative transcriptional regulator [Apilactobacillus kunkeei]
MEQSNYTSFNDWLENSKMPNGKRQVLKSAIKLFSQNGYQSTSTSSIAKDCGLSEATVFKHFKNKKELLDTIIIPIVNTLAPSFSEQFVESVSHHTFKIDEMIEYIITDRFHFIEENHQMISIMVSQLLIDDELKNQLEEIMLPKLSFIIDKANALMKQDDSVDDDVSAEELFRTISGQLLVSIVIEFKFPSDSWDTEKQIQSMIKVCKKVIHK